MVKPIGAADDEKEESGRIMAGHHLVLGSIADFITGEIIENSHDEQYRQSLARLLAERKGYAKEEIVPRNRLQAAAGDKKAVVNVDFKIVLSGKTLMIIKYGPGSIVTRHRPTLAASRLAAPYQIPRAVVTNGEDADVLDGFSGRVLSSGLESLPSREALLPLADADLPLISKDRAEKESRILYAYDVDGSCPCDDTICRL